jgi:hypothetical protein
MNPSQFKKLLGKMKQYYHKIHLDIHDDPHRSSRELRNIMDSNFTSFKDTPKFHKYIRQLSETQNDILDEKIAIEEERTRSRLRLTSLHEGWVRRGIEERPHNRERLTRRSSSRSSSRRSYNSSQGRNSSQGGKSQRRKTRKRHNL